MTRRTTKVKHLESNLEQVINLPRLRTGSTPPERLAQPIAVTPFFEVEAEAFLLRTPSGGRIHYSVGSGLTMSAPPGRSDEDIEPFVETAVFGAAAWIAGQVPLRATALRLTDGRLMLVARAKDESGDELTAMVSDTLGLAATSGPVVVMTDGPARAYTSGTAASLSVESIGALKDILSTQAEAPVRQDALRHRLALPAIDRATLHPCAGLISIKRVDSGERKFEVLGTLAAIPEIRSNVFQPQIGKSIWGKEVVAAAVMVIVNMMPVFLLTLPEDERPNSDMAKWLMSKQEIWGGQ